MNRFVAQLYWAFILVKDCLNPCQQVSDLENSVEHGFRRRRIVQSVVTQRILLSNRVKSLFDLYPTQRGIPK
jgi:hypothetical protein